MELAFVVWVGLDLGRSARGQVLPQAADDSSTPWKGFGPMRFVPIIGCVAEATKERVLIAVLKLRPYRYTTVLQLCIIGYPGNPACPGLTINERMNVLQE